MKDLVVESMHLTHKVFAEYIDVLDTMELMTKRYVPYIPNVYDMVNALPGVPWEEAAVPILQVVHRHSIFVKHNNSYLYKPILEVW